MNTLEATLHDAADYVVSRRLSSLAIFFLELHKPLVTIAYAGAIFSMPLFSLFFGRKRCEELAEVFSSRERVETLISLIEEKEHHAGR